MTAEDYEAAFHGIDLPPSIELVQGSIIPDLKEFLAKELYILKTSKNERVLNPIRYRLDIVLKLLESNEQKG
ncbi:MAG: hypothetical protein V4687_11640 [Bacteroidota bacterium]